MPLAPSILESPFTDDPRSHARRQLVMDSVNMVFDTRQGPVTALRDVNLEVRQQEFLSIVGPSGCGKSTILRLVAGLLAHSAGRIDVDGETPDQARRSRRFGFVFQSSVMLPWRTALQNVLLPSEVIRELTPARREKARDLLQQVGLKNVDDLYPRQLSGGMRQRVAIARALSYDPPILLMDEPFGALDALTRQKLHALLLEICQRARKTVIFITHDVGEAVLLSDRILVLSGSPGHVDLEVKVDLPRPRNEAVRTDPRFIELSERVLAALAH